MTQAYRFCEMAMKRMYLIVSVVLIGWGYLACETAYAQRANQSRTSTSSSNIGSTFPGSTFPSTNFNQRGNTTGFNQTQQGGPVGTRNSNQGLVGTNDFGQSTGGRRNTGRGRNQGLGVGRNQQNFGPGMDQFGMQNDFGQNPQGMTRRTIQPQHRVAFNYPLPSTTTVAGKIEKILAPQPKAKVQVRNLKIETGDEGVVTLRGEVKSDDLKQLAGLMVQFEPGVRKVQNELVVRGE